MNLNEENSQLRVTFYKDLAFHQLIQRRCERSGGNVSLFMNFQCVNTAVNRGAAMFFLFPTFLKMMPNSCYQY